MNRTLGVIAVCTLPFIAACDKRKAPENEAPAASAPVSAAPARASVEFLRPVPAAPAAEPAKGRIGGKSLNEVSTTDIGAALKQHGYEYGSGSSMKMGANEIVTVQATKGKDTVKLTLIRPTGKGDKGNMKMQGASEQKASFEARGATYLESEARVLVAVEIEGKRAAAQKLLEAILVR